MDDNSKWVRIFDINETSKHKKGFIIFKVISMLYSKDCPDVITKITVWKRYNDFKKLYREMKVLHRKLKIQGKFPSLPRGTFFKRYDEQILQEKKESALQFLEYIGSHKELFTSSEFVKFLESSHTPVDQLNSNINSIRADLQIPEDPEILAGNSDEDVAVSDTDSVSTISSASFSPQADLTENSAAANLLLKRSISNVSKNSDSLSISTIDSLTLLDGQILSDPASPSEQYIVDASVHVKLAEELEHDKKFEESFVAYKTAVDILERHGKDDKNHDRKQLVRYKKQKYMLRAEKLYNMYLAPEVRNLTNISEQSEEVLPSRPMSDLYKYKVMKVIGSGMLVIHSELQQVFYIKVINKTTKFLNENLILPENVPFMVKLHNYYNCDNALFLVLEYFNGITLQEYIQRISSDDNVFFKNADEVFKEVTNLDLSDTESEKSFSDLISSYTKSKHSNLFDSNDFEADFVKIDIDDLISENLDSTEIKCSKESKSLTKVKTKENCDNELKIEDEERLNAMLEVNSKEMNHRTFVPLFEIVKWASQIVIALEKLHILGVCCKDFGMNNILVDNQGNIVLTYMCNVNEFYDCFNLEKHCLAPEMYGIGPVTSAADWWSLGCILYELLVGLPLISIHPEGLKNHSVLKIPKHIPPESRSLLKQLLAYEPKERLGSGPHGVDNLKKHPFFRDVNWNDFFDSK